MSNIGLGSGLQMNWLMNTLWYNNRRVEAYFGYKVYRTLVTYKKAQNSLSAFVRSLEAELWAMSEVATVAVLRLAIVAEIKNKNYILPE